MEEEVPDIDILVEAMRIKTSSIMANVWKAGLLILVIIVIIVSFSGIFAYRAATNIAPIDYPVVWASDPRTPGVTVDIYKSGTAAFVNVSLSPSVVRIHRSAIYYDTFDDNPFTAGRMTGYTCTWSWSNTYGTLQISAASRGQSGWDYECMALANLDVRSYVVEGRRIYVAFLAWRTGFTTAPRFRVDAVYVNTETTGQFYRVGYNVTTQTGRTGDSLSSTIMAGTTLLSHVRFGTRLTLEYQYLSQVASMIDFTIWRAEHWNVTLLNSASIPAGVRYYPNRVGLGYWVSTSGFTGTVYFDNLVVTLDKPPWFVNFTGLPDGWRVRLVNREGRVIGEAVSTGGRASIPVWAPQLDLSVAGYTPTSDYGFVFRNARVEVIDAGGSSVYSGVFDYVAGGDVYMFSYRFGYPASSVILSINSNMTQGLNIGVEVSSLQCSPEGSKANATISLRLWDGRTTPQSITIVNGVIVVRSTGEVYASPPPSWTSSWLIGNITLSASLPYATTCNIDTEIKWRLPNGVYSIIHATIRLKTS